MICYYIVNLTSLLLVLVSAVSALPAISIPRRDIACPTFQLQSSGTGQIPGCSIDVAASTTRPLERKQELMVIIPRAKVIGAISAKKHAKIKERKERGLLQKKRKKAAIVGQAKQKQKWPPYGIHPDSGDLRRPEKGDVGKIAWKTMEEKRVRKQERTQAYNNLSPTKQEEYNKKSEEKNKEIQIKHKEENTKINNRQIRIQNKKNIRNQRKAANIQYSKAARAAFDKTSQKPSRDASYTSPQGKPYTGKDVRQAIFSYHLATAKKGVGYNARTGAPTLKPADKLPKVFHNELNKDPGREQSRPLPNLQANPNHPLWEFPIFHGKKMGYDGQKPTPTEARIIIQDDPQREGHHVLQGRVGHPHGSDDHVSF